MRNIEIRIDSRDMEPIYVVLVALSMLDTQLTDQERYALDGVRCLQELAIRSSKEFRSFVQVSSATASEYIERMIESSDSLILFWERFALVDIHMTVVVPYLIEANRLIPIFRQLFGDRVNIDNEWC